MNRVLVTGATGFIGRHTLAPLIASGSEVHAITSRMPPADAPEGVEWHVADLLEPSSSALIAALAPTHLLHLAWYAEPGRFWTSSENLSWLAASVRLLRAFTEAGGRRIVVAGTCAEYAWEPEIHCSEDSTALAPATLYGTAKHALQTVLARYAADAGIEFAWGRIFFTFGPNEHPGRLASSVARAVLAGEEARTSHGEQVRDFLYAPDLADAFVALLRSEVQGSVNIASGVPLRIRDLVEAIADAAGRPELVRLGALPANPSDPAVMTADVGRLRDEVGWTPPTPFGEAVHQTVEWWREQPQ